MRTEASVRRVYAFAENEGDAGGARAADTPPPPPNEFLVEFGFRAASATQFLPQLERHLRTSAVRDDILVIREVAGAFTQGPCLSVRFRREGLPALAAAVAGWAVTNLGREMIAVNGRHSCGSIGLGPAMQHPEMAIEYEIEFAVGLSQ